MAHSHDVPRIDPARLDAFKVTGSSPTSRSPSPGGGSRSSSRGDLGYATLDGDRRVAWARWGPPGAPAVAVLGGISAGRHVCDAPPPHASCGWWRDVVGPGQALDTDELQVVGFDYLGGLGDSWNPPGGAHCPLSDQVEALAAVLDGLGIARLDALVGASYGGFVGLGFARACPDRLARLVVIAAAHRSHPMAVGLRAIQRSVAVLGREAGAPDTGVALARALAMTTYRTAEEFAARFAAEGPESPTRPASVVEYLLDRGRELAGRCDVERYVGISSSLDAESVDPAGVRTPTTIVGITTDRLVPPALVGELAARLAGPTDIHWVDSPAGHDGFLTEPARIGGILRSSLAGGAGPCESRTRTVRASLAADRAHGAVMPPISLSANYEFAALGAPRRFDYARSGNPTRASLAAAIADLEGGAGAAITGSGLAAATLVLDTLEADDLVLAPADCYGGTRRLLRSLAERRKLRVEFARLWDEDELDARIGAVGPDPVGSRPPALVWIETPSNPLLRVTDIRRACTLARAAGARVLVDNTFLSPVLQRPLDLGADLVLHSTTKFLNGHSDVVGGAVVARDPEVAEELDWWANCLGVAGSAFDAWLTLRGLRTLHARIAAHRESAAAVVEVLVSHPAVERLRYPGLPDHPGHDTARRQQSGFGSLVTLELGSEVAVERFVSALTCFTLAESLGGVESLVAHPATMTHAALTADERAEAGITDSMVRLSLGIEDPRDLAADVARALDLVAAGFGAAGASGRTR